MTPEGNVKQYLKEQCKKRGWACLALEYPYKPGWPDTAIFIGNGITAFIETKASSTTHSREHIDNQKACMKWLHEKGHFAGFAVDKAGVDRCILMIERNMLWPIAGAFTGIETFGAV